MKKAIQMTSETYADWLMIPGNHRVVLQLTKQIALVLNQPAKIDSWRALYEYFEVVFSQDSTQIRIFKTIFNEKPPCVEFGATPDQVDLYQQISAEF